MYLKDNIISHRWRRLLQCLSLVACFFGVTATAFGLGLGELRVRSSLGQPLLVHSNVTGAENESLNPSCLRARVVSIDGAFIASATISIHQKQKMRALSFSTQQAINEPAINLIIDINCETQLHREFSILLDPPDVSAIAANVARDPSPFAKIDLPQVSSQAVAELTTAGNTSLKTAEKKKKQKASETLSTTFNEEFPTTQKKSKRLIDKGTASNVAPKDVLKLSDDIVFPEVPQGLRMSDILSSSSGQQLVENTQELRAAQARMAAILRDEAVPVLPSNVADGAEIASLKREAEKLRQQNLQDKSALAQLQAKSGFDYWVVILGIVAILAIGVVLFLLLYIRKNLSAQSATWWEDGEQVSENQPEKIEDVIASLQASYDEKPSSVAPNSDRMNRPVVDGKLTSVAIESERTNLNPTAQDGNHGNRTPSLEETNSSIFNFFAPRGNSVKVEEISDVTQEAEFWISMNDPQRAIEILAAQEQLEHPDSPVPWLFLLDLYRTVNDKQKYDRLRDRFIVFFNANIPEFEADLSSLPNRHLEDFPHLMQKICDAWNGSNIISYLESLLVDDREGKRAGFDLPVYRDILMLLGIAHELDRIMAIEGPIKENKSEVDVQLPLEENLADPIAETEFGTIEFETIDFPRMEVNKK
jgi:hypothetical protein